MYAKICPGKIGFCVVNSQLGVLIHKHPAFIHSGLSGCMVDPGINLTGHINDILVFVDTTLGYGESSILFGKVTNKKDIVEESGVMVCQFQKTLDTYETVDQSVELMLTTRQCFSNIDVEKETFHNYWYENVILRKKPIWRRLLFI